MLILIPVISLLSIIYRAPLTFGDISYQIPHHDNVSLLNIWSTNLGTSQRESLSIGLSALLASLPISTKLFFILNNLLPIFLLPVCYYLFLSFTGIKSAVARFSGSILSIFNPVLLGDFLNGQSIWPYLFIPWVIYFTYRIYALKDSHPTTPLCLGLSAFCLFGFLPPLALPLAIFELGLALCLVTLTLIELPNIDYLKSLIKPSLIAVTIFIVLSLPFIFVVGSGESAYNPSSSTADYIHNYQSTTFIYSLRLAGNEGNGQTRLSYNQSSMLNDFGYIDVFAVCYIFLVRSTRPKKFEHQSSLFLSSLFLSLLLVASLNVLATNHTLGMSFFNGNIVAATIRNPTKVYFFILPLFIFLLAYSINSIQQYSTKSIKIIASILVITSILAYGWPVLRGDMGLFYGNDKNTNNDYQISTTDMLIIKDSYSSQNTSIIIPSGHQDELSYQNTSNSLDTLRLGGYEPETSQQVNELNNDFNSENQDFKTILSNLGIKYIYLKRGTSYYDQSINDIFPVTINYSEAFNFLKNQGLPIVKTTHQYIKFENPNLIKQVYTSDKVAINDDGNNLPSSDSGVYKQDSLGAKMLGANYQTIDSSISNLPKVSSLFASENSFNNIANIHISKSYISRVSTNNSIQDLVYNSNLKELILSSQTDPILEVSNGNINWEYNKPTKLYETPLDKNTRYFLGLDNMFHSVVTNSLENLGTINNYQTITLYGTGGNLIKNSDFSNNMGWNNQVLDCNNHGNSGSLGMEIGHNTEGQELSFLELYARKDTACNDTNIFIPKSGPYVFGFAYRSYSSSPASYEIIFNNKQATTIRDSFQSDPRKWQSYAKEIDIPAGASRAKIYVYAYGSNEAINKIDYTNFIFSPLDKLYITSGKKSASSNYIFSAPIKKTTQISFSGSKYSKTNLINNGSFVSGPWQNTVSDCDDFNNNPDISMGIKNNSGANVLELVSISHLACTYTNIELNEGGAFEFSFNYKGNTNSEASYNLQFNDQNHTDLSYIVKTTGSIWHSYNNEIEIPQGATKATLTIYSYRLGGSANGIVLYKNFSFTKLPDLENAYYIVAQPKKPLPLDNPKSLSYISLNPELELVSFAHVSKNMFLGFNQSYQSDWQLYYAPNKVKLRRYSCESVICELNKINETFKLIKHPIEDSNHVLTNDFSNGWIINLNKAAHTSNSTFFRNSDGTYSGSIYIFFTPELTFYKYIILGSISALLVITYLVFNFFKQRHNSKHRFYVAKK